MVIRAKYFTVLILFFLIVSFLNAQSFVSVKMGPGISLGEFSADERLRLDGYAAAGFSFQVEGAYLPNKFLGLGLHYAYGLNPFTSEKFTNTDNSTFDKGKYIIHDLMALCVFQLYSNPELAIQARILPGLSFIKTPDVIKTTNYIFGRTYISHLFYEETTTQLAFKFGMCFRYMISKRFFCSLTTDYYYCNARFKEASIQENTLKIEQLYVLLGIDYIFNK